MQLKIDCGGGEGAKRVFPAPGTKVGSQRWPNIAAHPDCWERPWAGVVLAIDDPRAWANTLFCHVDKPDPAEVAAHVADCRSRGLLTSAVPIAWEFGKVFWDSTPVPYEEDLARWTAARWEAFQSVRAQPSRRAA